MGKAPLEVQKPRSRRGRTTLIVVLAVLPLGAIWWAHRRWRSTQELQTRWLITELTLACSNFQQKHGRYPWAKPEEVAADTHVSSADVHAELKGKGRINTSRDYLRRLPLWAVRGDGEILDIWGNPIRFRVDQQDCIPMVWSLGPNGLDETNDGESPDPEKKPKTYYWFGKGGFGDDIVAGVKAE